MLTLSKQSCASFLFASVTIIETSQPLHYAFGSYRRTCCIVHHLPTYRNAACNRFDGEGCSSSPIDRPALITKAASLDTYSAIATVRTVYNGKIIIDVPGWGQEAYVATNAVKGLGTGGVKIVDSNIVLSAHIYPGGYVQQRTNCNGVATGSGVMAATDLDYMINSGRTCIIGEFGNGTT